MISHDPAEIRIPGFDILDWHSITHADRPLVDDHSAAVLQDAIVELTLLRSPAALGDGLADLHAMASLLAQINAWLPIAVATARSQRHSWAEIASQLEIAPATARRRHRDYLTSTCPDRALVDPPSS